MPTRALNGAPQGDFPPFCGENRPIGGGRLGGVVTFPPDTVVK
jgi:hypothetical protein